MPERESHREQQPESCSFCEIVEKNGKASIITETDKSLAFMSLEGHPMILPKEHITSQTVDDNLKGLLDAFTLALSLLNPTREALNSTGINLVANLGEGSGQEIEHFHIHLIDRVRGDGKVTFAAGPRQEREELDRLAENIKNKLKQS